MFALHLKEKVIAMLEAISKESRSVQMGPGRKDLNTLHRQVRYSRSRSYPLPKCCGGMAECHRRLRRKEQY